MIEDLKERVDHHKIKKVKDKKVLSLRNLSAIMTQFLVPLKHQTDKDNQKEDLFVKRLLNVSQCKKV